MKKIRHFLALILVLLTILSMTSTVFAAKSDYDEQVMEMLTYYVYYRDRAETDIARICSEIGQDNPALGKAWEDTMAYWTWVDQHMEVTMDILPDGLPEDDSLCIVVLGYALNPTGSMTNQLVGRLEVALASATKYPNAYVLCTGGGTASKNSKKTEAGQMASWLRRKGIDDSRIIVENRSYSTSQNALYSYDILRDQYPQVKHLAMVTSDYHMSWGYMAFATKLALGTYVDLDPYMDIVSNAVYSTNSRKRNINNEYNQIIKVAGLDDSKYYVGSVAKLTSLAVRGSLRYYVGDELNLTVIAGYDNGYSRDVTAEALITDAELRIPGTCTVQIQYEENGVSFNTAVDIEILYLEEGATHPSEPEVILLEEVTEEPAPQTKKIPLSVLLILMAVLLVALWNLSERVKREKRRRKRRRPKMNLQS